MQDKSDRKKEFSDLSDQLCGQKNLSLTELAKEADISKEMFFGYRSGKYPVTKKALAKLKSLESSLTLSPSVPSEPRLESLLSALPSEHRHAFFRVIYDELDALSKRIGDVKGFENRLRSALEGLLSDASKLAKLAEMLPAADKLKKREEERIRLARSIRDGSLEKGYHTKSQTHSLKVIDGDPNGPPGAHGPGKRARNAGSGGVA
ncbi:hypothetical protein H5P28_00240 [Ruficoccus amylovorans]|uniref:Uncharacterized protein n=1 Tax=Ruficoccus amylovorans TaxID=1804625 RepID=A0A842H8K8_9BACT|nr:hypothetical protein [Ruficoccus amylovorans]MBC2592680.1 hypothetical protein [Ruficoccus amylovorans]